MVKSNPFLLVKNGKVAVELYKELFGAKLISHMPFTKEMSKEFGFPKDFDYENSTMHAVLDIEGAEIMLADNTGGVLGGGNVEIVLHLDNKKQLEKIYNKAKEKKFKIKMELQQTFWGAWYARFEDLEGVGWQLNFQERSLEDSKKAPSKTPPKKSPKKAPKKRTAKK
ncbi:MAG: VOC family protein [Candidatus Thorarchaeota archaeon]